VRPLRFLGALALTVIAHVATASVSPQLLNAVDLFVVLTVLNGMNGGSLAGMLGGTTAGLCQDTLSGSVFGLHGFTATILGYAASRISQRLVLRRVSGALLLISSAVLVQAVALLALSALTLPELILPDPFWLLVRAGVSGVLGALIYFLVTRWRQGADARRKRRTRRLRMG